MSPEPNQRELQLNVYLEQFREASRYTSERLGTVYVLHNVAVLMTGLTGAIVTGFAAIGRLIEPPLDIGSYLVFLLAGPWILVPTALMILRNHVYIDLAEKYVADVLTTAVRDLLHDEHVRRFRVSLTREATLNNPSRWGWFPWGWILMALLALAEYAIPLVMSILFLIGFHVLRGEKILPYERAFFYLDVALLAFLVTAVILGRWKRPHEEVFKKAD